MLERIFVLLACAISLLQFFRRCTVSCTKVESMLIAGKAECLCTTLFPQVIFSKNSNLTLFSSIHKAVSSVGRFPLGNILLSSPVNFRKPSMKLIATVICTVVLCSSVQFSLISSLSLSLQYLNFSPFQNHSLLNPGRNSRQSSTYLKYLHLHHYIRQCSCKPHAYWPS